METERASSQVARPRIDYQKLEELGRELLIAIGEDPTREGLVETPARWARFWREFMEYDPGKVDTTFEAITTDQMVVVSGMKVWSLCEHHMLPFWCEVSVGYIARDRVLGLSKFARIANQAAHKLQLQERLVHEIADEVERITSSHDVAVIAKGVHTCMTMRGVRVDAAATTSVMRGVFYDDQKPRLEFLEIAR